MNILIIHPVSCLAGAEFYLISLVKSLDKKYQCFYLCQEPGPLTEALEKLNVKIIYMRMRAWRRFKYWFLNLLTLRKIIQLCRANKIQLILSNSYRITPYAFFTAKALKVPCLTVIHDIIPTIKIKRFRAFNSDRLIAVSESIRENIKSYGFPKEVHMVYNGIDADGFSQLVKDKERIFREFNIRPDQKIVGIIGSVIPWKGHKVFLQAMKIVAQEFPQAVFFVIGDSPDMNQLTIGELEEFARSLGLQGKVIFTGNRSDIPDLLSAFDVLVSCSEKEAFGRVMIEAMSLKKPVVATDCGGPREIVVNGKTGYLTKVNNIDQTVECVLKLLRDPGLARQMGEEGYRRVKEVFPPDKTVGQFNEIFEELLDNRLG